MDTFIFLLTDVNLNETLGENTIILGITVGVLFVALLLVDKGLSIFEKIWDSLSDKIYNPSGDPSDPFSDFTGLDQSVIQVVTDTGVKFEDVAGNEEAKGELKEVVKFLKDPDKVTYCGVNIGGLNGISVKIKLKSSEFHLLSKAKIEVSPAIALKVMYEVRLPPLSSSPPIQVKLPHSPE